MCFQDENALGLAYRSLAFRDVMIRSLEDGRKHLAWRHPEQFKNIQSIVKVTNIACMQNCIGAPQAVLI